jgi:uncharacterized protein (DUF362 family)
VLLSIVSDEQLQYPDGAESYSPDTRYPEYRFDLIASTPNRVYDAVRRCFAQAGFDRENFGTANWNPLRDFVQPGQRVFVLCNFVYHRRANETAEAFRSKCTHGSVVRAVVDYLLLAVGERGQVRFGNAAVQSCSWPTVLEQTGTARVQEFYARVGANAAASDLRMYIAERDAIGNIAEVVERDAEALTVNVDLGSSSLLDEPSRHGARYRVQDYDPQRTEAFHAPGKHVYVVHRDVLDADVIFSIPKIKTHEKVGVTCAVKGCVGAVGHKDCLAHHRFGPATKGGDEYPRDPFGLFRAASRFHDRVYRASAARPSSAKLRVADTFLRKVLKRINPSVAGAWWGNDTAWRMAVDLARIIEHCDRDGVLHDAKVRTHVALVDGVVGGEGRGPLRPEPVDSRTLFFSDDAVLADYAAAVLMGFDPLAVPHLRHAVLDASSPIHRSGLREAARIITATEEGGVGLLQRYARRYAPPPGWKGHL